MISFVWPDHMPFVPWAGGSEVYTLGQLRELQRRGIPTRLIACNPMVAESLAKFPDIPSLALKNKAELANLDDTIVFLFEPVRVKTKRPAFVMVHVPIKGPLYDDTPAFADNALGDMRLITTSRYMATYWQKELGLPQTPPVVYPFADHVFSEVSRPPRPAGKPLRILFAGRPTQEKGVYTLLASLHMPPLRDAAFELSCIANINHFGGADVVNALYRAHPQIKALPPRNTRESMAELYAEHDIVVMPSSSVLWREAFGMTSVEAQQAGCRVVASDDGGLPETDCGGLLLVEPDNPLTLAQGMAEAIRLGPLSLGERKGAAKRFTVQQSVDALLEVVS